METNENLYEIDKFLEKHKTVKNRTFKYLQIPISI